MIYLFDLGNSNTGPVGVVYEIRADTKEEALEKLQQEFQTDVPVVVSGSSGEARIYLNVQAVSLANILDVIPETDNQEDSVARKFFKTVMQVTVLSEDRPVGRDLRLHEIEHEITTGGCSGVKEVVSETELTPQEMAKALIEQDSDPEFFQLDENGNEVQT